MSERVMTVLESFLRVEVMNALNEQARGLPDVLAGIQAGLDAEAVLAIQRAIDDDASRQQLKTLGKNLFGLSLGMSITLASMIQSYQALLRTPRLLTTSVRLNRGALSLWCAWMQGHVTPAYVFEQVATALEKRLLTETESEMIVNAMLAESGFFTSKLHERVLVEISNMGDLLDISNVSCGGLPQDPRLTLSSSATRCSAMITLQPTSFPDIFPAVTLAGQLCHPINMFNPLGTPSGEPEEYWWVHADNNNPVYSLYAAGSIRVISIGASTRVNSHHVLIDEVIVVQMSLDVLSNEGHHTLTILFQGRYPQSKYDDCLDDSVSEASTEICPSDWEDTESDINENSSGQSTPLPRTEHENQVPFQRTYFIMTGIVMGRGGGVGIVRIHTVHALHGLYKDQRPTSLLHLDEAGKILVAGSSGLLALVDARSDEGVIKANMLHMNADSTLVSKSNVTHRADAVICKVDYSYRAGAIASADHLGTVCLWKLYMKPHRIRNAQQSQVSLHCTPLRLNSRVHYLIFCPSGEQIIAAVVDKLYLLASYLDPLTSTRYLRVQAILDTVPGLRALYRVCFDDEVMRVWRVMSCGYEEDRLSITSWLHPRCDLVNGCTRTLSEQVHRQNLLASALGRLRYSPEPIHIKGITTSAAVNIQLMSLTDSPSLIHRMARLFQHDSSDEYSMVLPVLEILCASTVPLPISILESALNLSARDLHEILHSSVLCHLIDVDTPGGSVFFKSMALCLWLQDISRTGHEFWVDSRGGHNVLTAVYLRYCANKSISHEHRDQEHLKKYGLSHFYNCSRGLRLLTTEVRKIDETAGLSSVLPYQLGYVVGLQEVYARRVGLVGPLPSELGELWQLRVLSLGNNRLSGSLPSSLGHLTNLQRIVLHQNKLSGAIPLDLCRLGCIVNLAGNTGLDHGIDVDDSERTALVDLFKATKGVTWSNRQNWNTEEPVHSWYKVGTLGGHVHSIVMSSNGMSGRLPASIIGLTHLRMIELATMTGLTGSLPEELCRLTALKRLCICRCAVRGSIPARIGDLIALEELQLFGNQLSGIIPSSLSKLTSLRLLSLGEYTGGNSFSPATLPDAISCLTQLEALFMANCSLKGSLPSWIGCLTELRQLDLQRNQMSGVLPASLGNCTNLLYLNLKDNTGLCGLLPISSLARLTRLNRLSLVHCSFSNTDAAAAQLEILLPRCKLWI